MININSKFLHSKADSPNTITNTLKKNGIAYLPNYLDFNAIAAINAEFDRLFESENKYCNLFTKNSRKGFNINLINLNRKSFPKITSLFYSSFVKSICDAYFGQKKYLFNNIMKAEMHWSLNENTKITDAHFDAIHALKFILYLNDITYLNGAFKYSPETHISNSKFAQEYFIRGGQVRRIPNVCFPSEIQKLISIEGQAGTLIIFDTDGFHGDSCVYPGYSRKVIRVHSYSCPKMELYPGLLSHQYWRESIFNLNRYFKPFLHIPPRYTTGGVTPRIKQSVLWEDLFKDIFFPIKNTLPKSLRSTAKKYLKGK